MLSNEIIKRSTQLPSVRDAPVPLVSIVELTETSTALIRSDSIPDSDSIPKWKPDGPKTPSEETQIFYPYSDGSVLSEVEKFCINNSLENALTKAKTFVNESFSDIKTLKSRLVVDPEDGKERVKIHITIPPADTETFLTNYNNYTRKLVEEISWEERTMLLFDFSIEE